MGAYSLFPICKYPLTFNHFVQEVTYYSPTIHPCVGGTVPHIDSNTDGECRIWEDSPSLATNLHNEEQHLNAFSDKECRSGMR